MATTLSASLVPKNEINELTKLSESLPEGSALGQVLEEMSVGLRNGVGVTIARNNEQVTPSKAASFLGISRTHLYKILDAGLIPFHIVGEKDRRMNMVDVQNYFTKTMAFRAADAVSIAKRDQLEDSIFDSME